jgi:hypothetical protein
MTRREAELRAYIAQDGGPTDIPQPRKLSFDPGYRAEFWHRNCVAIGLSAGFIEPLEASALAVVEMSAAMLADDLPVTRQEMAIAARRFNEAFTYRWERVIDFLKLHYVLSERNDSLYWQDNRDTVPGRLAELLTRCGATARLRAMISTASRKCSRRPATSTSCTAWASAPSQAARPPRRARRNWPTATSTMRPA